VPLSGLVGLAAPDRHPIAVGDLGEIGHGERDQLGAAEGAGEAEGENGTIADAQHGASVALVEHGPYAIGGRSRLALGRMGLLLVGENTGY
jgi:hypothetical protein